MAQPNVLSLPIVANHKTVEYFDPGASGMRQLKVASGLVNITTVNANSFQLDFFHAPTVSATKNSSGYYTTTGSSFVRYAITNLDNSAACNRLQVTETRGTATRPFLSTYAPANLSWELLEPDGQTKHVTTRSDVSISGSTRTNRVTETYFGSQLLSRLSQTHEFRAALGHELLLQEVRGVGTQTETDTYTYYANDPVNLLGNANKLQRVVRAEGSWEHYVYDDAGFRSIAYSGMANQAPPAAGVEPQPTDYCRKTTYVNEPSSLVASSIESLPVLNGATWQWQAITRSDTARTLATITETRTDVQTGQVQTEISGKFNSAVGTLDSRDGFQQFQSHADGTVALYDYARLTDGSLVTTNRSGSLRAGASWAAPFANGGLENIEDGVQNVSIVDPVGRPVSTVSYSVAGGTVGTTAISSLTYTYNSSDLSGRNYTTTDIAGRVNTYTFDCCGLSQQTDPDGGTTVYLYDPLSKRQTGMQRYIGNPANTPYIETSQVLDALGRTLVTKRKGTSNSEIITSRTQYDILGNAFRQTNALNGVSTMTNVVIGNQRYVTNTAPDGGQRIDIHYRDGQLERTIGSATQPMRYEYGVEPEGGYYRQFTKQIHLNTSGTDTGEWVKSYTDGLGRNYKTVYPGGAYAQTFYNANGQVCKQRDPDGVLTLSDYDGEGRPLYSTLGVNANSEGDIAGLDRITWSSNDVVSAHGTLVHRRQTYAFGTNYNGTPTLLSTTETSVDGLRSWNTAWNNGAGATSSSVTSYAANGARTITSTAPDNSYTIAIYSYGRLLSVTRYGANNSQLGATTYAYDAHGRQSTVTDARTGATTLGYNNADLVTTNKAQGLTTSTEYNTSLRAWRTTQPDGGKMTNEFYLTGQLKKTTGVRTYPVEYTYDYAGRMATMKTWTNYPTGSPAITTWNYDPNRGWLTKKVYQGETDTSDDYEYFASGRLWKRHWERGTTTTYGYNGAGDLATVDYSDTTADVTYGYDRRGRQTSMAQSGGTTTTRVFSDAGQMLAESYAGGPLDGMSVTNGFDALSRRTVLAINNQLSTINSFTYGFSTTSGRLATVADGVNSATYSYLANSPLVSQILFKQNTTTRMTTTKNYDLLNRLLAITSTPITQTPNPISYTYAYNSVGQRYQVNVVADGETSQWQYGYDTLGQVISGKHLLGGTRLAGEHFEYAFDTIGNRKSTKSGGEASFFYPTTLRSSAYTVNALNQYTSRTVPGYVDILGVVTNSAAKVWINKQAPERHPIFPTHFRKELTVANTAGPVWLGVTNLAILNQGSNPDLIATNKGNVLVPKTPEVFAYDADGNQTSDSLWVNTWNAENRRVVIESCTTSGTGVPVAARAREVWTHLPDGRWIERIVSTNNGSDYVPVLTNRYIWDGNVLLAVLNNVNGLELSFMRGLDLSGTLQGAGGVGGLLAVRDQSTINSQPSTHFAAYDGNGNVTMLVNAADGKESARYEYGPFAEPLRMTGPMAKINPIRFSTQYADDVTGDIKYLFRDYTSGTGRWPNRDPLGEPGFETLRRKRSQVYGSAGNVHSLLSNNPINDFDVFGLFEYEWESNFTDAEKKAIQDSIGRVKDRANALIKQLDDNIANLKKCPCPAYDELAKKLEGLKKVLQGMIKEIEDPGWNLEIHKKSIKPNDALYWDAGWSFWYDDELTLDLGWFEKSSFIQDTTILHELSHGQGTDDYSENPWNNPHLFENLMRVDKEDWIIWKDDKKKADEKCKPTK